MTPPTFLLTASCTNSHHNIRLMQLTCMLCQSAKWKRSASTRIQPTALRCCVLDFSHGKFATFINSAPVVAFTNARKTLPMPCIFTAKDYKRLAPYIRISSDYLPASSLADVRRGRHHSYYNRTTSTHYSNEQNIKESAYSQNKKTACLHTQNQARRDPEDKQLRHNRIEENTGNRQLLCPTYSRLPHTPRRVCFERTTA